MLELRHAQLLAMSELSVFFNQTNKREDFGKEARQERKRLVNGKTFLVSCHRSLIQNLNDTYLGADVEMSRKNLADAYIKELSIALEKTSNKVDRIREVRRWSRSRLVKEVGVYSGTQRSKSSFVKEVHEYLGIKPSSELDSQVYFCNVIGKWMSSGDVKVTHIIPWSWDCKAMDYAFGSQEKCLESNRNGVCLQRKIERAFDKCEVTIVPVSVENTPTKWKIVVLKDSIANNLFYVDVDPYTNKRVFWKWSDIDGRQLTFFNDNRPARRFLYLRHILALIHAKQNPWLNYRQKVPCGEVWVSSAKSEEH